MRLLGHPVHPILVAFPIALLGITPVWDVIALLNVSIASDARVAGYFCEVAGLVVGGLAIVAGFADFMTIASDSAAAKAGLIHASLALGMISLFGVAFALRGGRTATPSALVLGLELAGALCLAVTGWFGGHLVFRHAVGVRASGGGAGPSQVTRR
jgi:uncharacterized membrane protein